jgi:hypothetical protein
MCTPGEVLCACRGDGTCDMGLACVPEGCIPDACNPGEAMCTCLQPGDVCAQGSTCIEGLCRDEPITTDGMTSMPSESDSTMEPPMTSTMPSTTDATDDTTVGMLDTGGPGTSGGSACEDEGTCIACAQCASSTDCSEQTVDCMADNVCLGALMCLNNCLNGDAMTVQACIAECDCEGGGELLDVVVACVGGICEPVCEVDLTCVD